ncbi:TonB-dependent receptor [Flavihumibacter sp. ZG627]|uniref:TonB-dependent receptor n=1 Tax=Flavihumibacter sp. ZG627 TaxID=1463156 RepID=UPI0005807903|nr:TonB-dependent receptor [Flavihumibacter sp. ZG627]KIC92314.1 hypothetical protein HY58_01890 [Flavihumibacter sp. ZG627]
MLRLISLLFFTQLTSLAAFSQVSTGKITGKILDISNNEAISGASISVKNARYGSSSVMDGSYQISLPAGTYTLQFSHLGHRSKEITDIIVKAGQSTVLDILLETATKELEGVVVTSSVKKEAQASVYSAQKRSAAASDGISAEVIKKTPDNNAGQILKRVTGVNVQGNRFVVVRGLADQYNQTMLNGVPMTSTETNRNAFAFDLIPAAIIDNIVVNKTATPDMPGNFAGGIVQINTKDFPASDFFTVSLQLGFSDETIGKDFYTDERASMEFLGFGVKKRALPAEFPTALYRIPFVELNTQEQFRYLKMLNNNLAPVNYGASMPNESFQVGFGKTIKFRDNSELGIVAAFNQRKTELIEHETSLKDPDLLWNFERNDTTKLHFSLMDYYSENIRYKYHVDLGGALNIAYRFGNNKISLKNLVSQVYDNTFMDMPFLRIEGFDFKGYNQVGIRHIIEQRRLYNSVLGGEHRTGLKNQTRIDWNVNLTGNNTRTPDTRNFLFNTDSTGKILQVDGNFDLANSLKRLSRIWSDANDFIYGGAFNIVTPLNTGKATHLIKGGLLFQTRDRNVEGIFLPVSNLKGTVDSILSPSNYHPNGGRIELVNASMASGAGNYTAGSSVVAGYGSIESKLGSKLRVIWGARFENYQQFVNVYTPVFFDNFTDPELQNTSLAARTTFNFLPSINIIWSPVPKINVRASYSKTVIRPELKDLADFPRYDFLTLVFSRGNSGLKSTSIDNFDLKFEWFPSAGEILSLSAFHKNMENPIEYGRPFNENIRIPVNTGTAEVSGLEAEIRKTLDFLPFAKWLENVNAFANATLLKSKVPSGALNNFYINSTPEHPLTGQPDYILNAGLSIRLLKNTMELTGSYNRTGDHITELGSNLEMINIFDSKVTVTPAYHLKARNQLDFVLTKSFLDNKLNMKFNLINLLKDPVIIYQDLNGNGKMDELIRPVQVKGQPQLTYSSGIDNASSYIISQRSYSLTVSYTF